MSDCGCGPGEVETAQQRRALIAALVLNAVMFVVEVGFGLHAGSTGLIADGLDMLSDAAVYAIALAAIGRSSKFKVKAANFSGIMLLLLGIAVVAEAVRRALYGSEPEGLTMIVIACIAMAANVYVLRLLRQQDRSEIHLRAAWIFTRADVIANGAVILSGLAVLATGIAGFDLVAGIAIGLYVVREAIEILSEARRARTS